MNTHELVQGSPEWHQHRANYFNASDAPAMMGVSPYKTRSQLLHERATGVTPEVDASTQKRFDDGHRFEALARALAEEIIGEELYPIVGSDGKYSASFDGLTMLEDVAFEHKTLNTDICNAMSVDDLHPMYHIQMEQQLMVSGAAKCLFLASKWDDQGDLIDSRHFWYEQNLELRQKIVDGWSQFERDLEAYTPEPEYIPAKPEPVMALPALSIQVGGSISIQSNLDRFGERLKSFISETNAKPETDQEFANLEQACKVLKEAEDALKQAESNALAQTASVDEMRRTVAFLADMARTNRLTFEKLVKSEKENRKAQIVDAARLAFESHCRAIQADLPVLFINKHVIFAEAIKGKKTISSMQDAVNTMLANAKIEADALARQLREKHTWYIENGSKHSFLFSDLQGIIYKPTEDFQATVINRISQHMEQERIKAEQTAKAQAEREARIAAEAEEKARIEAEAKAEAERERIRQEEATKLRAEQESKVIAEAIETRAEIEKKVYKQTDIETITENPADPRKIEDPIDRLIASLVLRIESGDMTIRDALMVAYQAGTERAVAA
jgi:putative phage-type endonuclease